MDILDAIAIEIPCQVCGGRYEVPLKQLLLSHKMLHEGCPVPWTEECPPLSYSQLVDQEIIQELEIVWQRLEQHARGVGGELKVRP
jgi:hypothetical protein